MNRGGGEKNMMNCTSGERIEKNEEGKRGEGRGGGEEGKGTH